MMPSVEEQTETHLIDILGGHSVNDRCEVSTGQRKDLLLEDLCAE